jgi:hypothetical protein
MSEEQEDVGPPGVPSGGPGPGSGLGRGRPRFFQIPVEAQSVVFVIDRSASMGEHGAWELAKRELRTSLERLPPETRFQVIAYNRTAEPLFLDGAATLVPATLPNKLRTGALLDTLPTEGGTDHFKALRRALALRADVVFFLTDAAELRADQVRAVTLLNQGRSAIHAVELCAGRRTNGPTRLAELARANHGTYQSASLGP